MKRFILWPSYFDSSLSKKGGRRVQKSIGVETPTVDEIASAAKKLGLDPEVDRSKVFPSTPWVKGRIFVSRKYSKQETIRRIGRILKGRRGDEGAQS
jgi:signal recognition particle subunit SRP19